MSSKLPGRDPRPPFADHPAGLCPSCKHVKRIVSNRGSTFLLCRRSKQDEAFRKYPPQPVRRCLGYES